MDELNTLSEIDLVNASGQRVHATVDLDWRIRIEDRVLPTYSSVEGLCLTALHSVAGTFVSIDHIKDIISQVHEEGVGKRASQNTLLKDEADFNERCSKAIGKLCLHDSPFFDNIAVFDVSKGLWILIKNFNDWSPEDDKRQAMIDSAVGLSEHQLNRLKILMKKDFNNKARRAYDKKKLKELQPESVIIPPPKVLRTTEVRVKKPVVPQKETGQEVVVPVSETKVRPAKQKKPTKKPKVPKDPEPPKTPITPKEIDGFTDPRTYANDLYWSIDEIPHGSYTNSALVSNSSILRSVSPNPSDIERILMLAVDKRILKLEKRMNPRTNTIETFYQKI